MYTILPTLQQFKKETYLYCETTKEEISHSEALDIVAQEYKYKNYSTIKPHLKDGFATKDEMDTLKEWAKKITDKEKELGNSEEIVFHKQNRDLGIFGQIVYSHTEKSFVIRIIFRNEDKFVNREVGGDTTATAIQYFHDEKIPKLHEPELKEWWDEAFRIETIKKIASDKSSRRLLNELKRGDLYYGTESGKLYEITKVGKVFTSFIELDGKPIGPDEVPKNKRKNGISEYILLEKDAEPAVARPKRLKSRPGIRGEITYWDQKNQEGLFPVDHTPFYWHKDLFHDKYIGKIIRD